MKVELALKINKLIHDECTNVPHDIGWRIVRMLELEKLTPTTVVQVCECAEPKETGWYADAWKCVCGGVYID